MVPDGFGSLSKPGSSPVRFPPPRHMHTVRLLTAEGARVLHMFDATDDLWREPLQPTRVRTCALVIDSVNAFRAGMPPVLPAEVGDARPNTSSPGVAYGKAIKQIKAMGLDSRETRLAVVFAHGNLVNSPDRKVVRWVRHELGLGDLVSSARRDFKESHFFCADAETHAHSANLLRWLLAADGVTLARNRIVIDVRAEEEIAYRWHRRYVFVAVLAVIGAVLVLLFTS
jgi:hypothetical protein